MAQNSKEKQKEYDQKRAEMRGRNWVVVIYPEDLPSNWEQLLSSLHIKLLLSPFHDKDVNADGSPKKPHHHLLLMFDNHKTAKQVYEVMSKITEKNENGSLCGVAPIVPHECKVADRGAMVRYFCHLDNPGKAQYDTSELKGFNGADVAELLKRSLSEQQSILIAIEEFCEENDITEICVLAKAIRYSQPEWYRCLTTQSTTYLKAYLTSLRNHRKDLEETGKVDYNGDSISRVDKETGELLEAHLPMKRNVLTFTNPVKELKVIEDDEPYPFD